jgi:hypothetical protein
MPTAELRGYHQIRQAYGAIMTIARERSFRRHAARAPL